MAMNHRDHNSESQTLNEGNSARRRPSITSSQALSVSVTKSMSPLCKTFFGWWKAFSISCPADSATAMAMRSHLRRVSGGEGGGGTK